MASRDLKGAPATIENHGFLALSYVFVQTEDAPALHTGPTATTTLAATDLAPVDAGGRPDPSLMLCTGAPVASQGYNHTYNESCSFGDPTDVQDGEIVVLPDGRLDFGWSFVDRIPPGVLGCGELNVVDMGGQSCPVAFFPTADPPACDIGEEEHRPH